MIFYRLSDDQARGATYAIIIALPTTLLLALSLANEGRYRLAIGFGVFMILSLTLIAVRVGQSRRLNANERGAENG